MHRILIEWRGIRIYSYPAMLYLGLVTGIFGGVSAASPHGLSPARILPPMLLLSAFAVACGRLSFVALHWRTYCRDWSRIWSRSEGGAMQYGGLVLAFFVSLPLLAVYRISVGAFWDTAIITILVGKVFTRVGCL